MTLKGIEVAVDNAATVSLARRLVVSMGYKIINPDIHDERVQRVVLFNDGDCVLSPNDFQLYERVPTLHDLFVRGGGLIPPVPKSGRISSGVQVHVIPMSWHRKVLIGVLFVVGSIVERVTKWVRKNG